jgi:RNA-directed DNA polymerase
MNDIRKTQRSFARKANAQKEHQFGDLYHLICRREWMETALEAVLSNPGARTAGVDGVSKKDLETPEQRAAFVDALQMKLKSHTFKPDPVRRRWIPKPDKDEKRPLGIPTLQDRVVQELLRMLFEPIWESDFLPCSHGFRPGHRTMDCIATFYSNINRLHKYFWIIEGDIRKCFDCVHHGILLKLIQRRIADTRILGLVNAFLKAGVMDEGLFEDTPEGTPQGGILSPLLANIYLHELDLWWWRKFGNLTTWKRTQRRSKHQGLAILVRYADDFVFLWNGTHQEALTLRDELKRFLWDELRLELSEEKTQVTHATEGFDFLGFNIRWETPTGKRPWLRVHPTTRNLERFRHRIKAMTKRGTTLLTPELKFKTLNRVLWGWGNYYRHVSFSHDASELDWWVNQRVLIWLQNKHPKLGVRKILERYKLREVTPRYDRWNFAVQDTKGKMVFIARMQDIVLRPYPNKRFSNPYLNEDEEPIPATFSEGPFLEPRLGNVNPESLEWLEAKAATKERDDYRCVVCGRTEDLLDAHHIQARREGGTDDLDNLITLCRNCHAKTRTYGRPPKQV